MVNVDCAEAGRGKLTACVDGPHGEEVDAGNNETSKTSTMSKSLLLLLDEGEEVHLVALKNPDGKFPYQGHFITFCASLMEKKGTKAAFPGKAEETYPVLGIRAK